ncbi:hypothetical protein KFE98_19775 [bacterium SCSIO 12741]|nr:hypothetical protein KFE98_19775 [bacterium SCSIO 12741]
MQYDPYNLEATYVSSSSANLSFDCNVGEGKNLSYSGHTPGIPEGEVIFELVNDPNQPNETVHIHNQLISGLESGENKLMVLVKEGGDVKGRGIVTIL